MKIAHVYSTFGYSLHWPDNVKRARESWEYDSEFLDQGIPIKEMERHAGTEIGDSKEVPYVHDLIDKGFRYGIDAVCLTNWDIGIVAGGVQRIKELAKRGGGYAFRRDFLRPIRRPITWEYLERASQESKGIDLILVTKKWWESRKDILPRMFLGYEGWDWVFRFQMEQDGLEEGLDNLIYHVYHGTPSWRTNRLTAPANLWNRRAALLWSKSLEPSALEHVISEWPELKLVLKDPALPPEVIKKQDSGLKQPTLVPNAKSQNLAEGKSRGTQFGQKLFSEGAEGGTEAGAAKEPENIG